MSGLCINVHVSDVLASNMYLVCNGNHAIMIDPFPCEGIIDEVELDAILLTHEHYDHISGVDYWRDLTDARVVCSEACAKGCCDSRKNLSRYSDVIAEMSSWAPSGLQPVPAFECELEGSFSDEMRFDWRGHDVRLFECPGHSPGSMGILLDGEVLFSGDSLLDGMPTELHFPGGNMRDWEEIGKPRLKSLNPQTRVYPGHLNSFMLADYDCW